MLNTLKDVIFPELDKINIEYRKLINANSLNRDQAFSLID